MATLQKNIGMELDKPSSIGAGSFDPETYQKAIESDLMVLLLFTIQISMM